MTLRDAVFPDESVALIVTVLNPVSSGMVTLHWDVPVAVPDCPKPFDQVTDATLPVAVPLNKIDEADVETEVDEGDVMVSAIDPLPPEVPPDEPPDEPDDEDAFWRVIVTV